MRTIQVINSKWYNATAWYALYLAKILNEHGHKSLVITNTDSVILSKIHEFNVDFIDLPLNSSKPRDILFSWRKLTKIYKEFQPDVINCHRGEAFYLFGLLKQRFGNILIRTRGDQRFPNLGIINKFLHNNVADSIITSNSAMSEFFIKKMHTSPAKVHTILGGVDTQKFYPQKENRNFIRDKYGFSEQDILLGVIGRFDPIKGFHETVQAFAAALRQSSEAHKKLHLLIAGIYCFFSKHDLIKLATELSIPTDHIHFYDYINDMNSFMNMLDVGIIASLGSETIARVAFEMLACHTPIIGSRVGVMPDILDEQYLFSPGNIEEMAAMFIRCLDDNFRKQLLKTCIGHFYGPKNMQSVYGWTMEDFYQKTFNVYFQLIKDKQ